MAINVCCILIGLVLTSSVFSQNPGDAQSLDWLNNLLMVPNIPNVNMRQNDTVLNESVETAPNLNPVEVTQTPCENENGEDGFCVFYYQCEPYSRSLITDGSTIIDIRERQGICPNYLEVCCKSNNTDTTTKATMLMADSIENTLHSNGILYNDFKLLNLFIVILYRLF